MQPAGIGPNLVRILANVAPDLLAELLTPGRTLEADVVSVFGGRAILSFGRGARLEVGAQAELTEGQRVMVQVQPREVGDPKAPLVLKLVTSGSAPDRPLVVTYSATPQGATPTPQGATPAPQGATPAPQGATPAPQGATPASQGATPAPQGATPAPQGATPAPQGATPASQGATSTPEGATPTPQGAIATPENATPVSTENATPAPQGATLSPQASSPVPAESTALTPQGATPAPQGATPAPQGATPAPQGATPAPQGATPAPQGATPAPQGATPAPQGATPAPPAPTSSTTTTIVPTPIVSTKPPETNPAPQAPGPPETAPIVSTEPTAAPQGATTTGLRPTSPTQPAPSQPLAPTQAPQAQPQAPPGTPQLFWLPIPLPNGGQAWAQIHVQEEPARKGRRRAGTPGHQIRLWWETPGLGPVQVTMDAAEHSLTTLFTVPRPATRTEVERSLPELQQQLAQAGFPDNRLGCRQPLPGEAIEPDRGDGLGRIDRRM